MLFVVRFYDKPGHAALRATWLAAHLVWLKANAQVVRLAGSLRDVDTAPASGGLWIVDADSREQIDRLIETDPFWIEGLRETYEVLHYARADPGHRVTF